MTNNRRHLIVLAGPTAVGKTDLSISLANHFNCDIVSADSRQFYKEMTIGTAKPSLEELNAAPHHFINTHSIHSPLSAGRYETEAVAVLEKCFEKSNIAILTGGSGLFLKAVYDGLDEFPEVTEEAKIKVKSIFESEGNEGLRRALYEIDLEYAKEVDLNNNHRIMRALEVCFSQEAPFSKFRNKQVKKRDFTCIKIMLDRDREELYDRINRRVDTMINDGLIEEVRNLHTYKDLKSLQTVGYQELFPYLEDSTNLADACSLIKRNTRRYAKRQLTWFRREEGFTWFHPEKREEIVKFIENKLSE